MVSKSSLLVIEILLFFTLLSQFNQFHVVLNIFLKIYSALIDLSSFPYPSVRRSKFVYGILVFPMVFTYAIHRIIFHVFTLIAVGEQLCNSPVCHFLILLSFPPTWFQIRSDTT
jgi:hypothetical protein